MQGRPARKIHEDTNKSWPALRPHVEFLELHRDLVNPIFNLQDAALDHVCSVFRER